MLIATSIGPNDGCMLDFEEFISYGLRQLGHEVVKYDWKTSEKEILDILSRVDISFIPVHQLTNWRRDFNNRPFIEKLNSLKGAVVLEVIDEPKILPKMEKYVIPFYRRMIWPHTLMNLSKYKNCEKVIQEPIAGEYYCYHKKTLSKEYDVIFNGSLYPFRIDFLSSFISKLRKDINFKIFSKCLPSAKMKIEDKYWGNKSNVFLTHQTLNDIYNKSKILLLFGIYADSINHYSEKDLENIDETLGRSSGYPCRIFSYAGSGSLVLADRRKEGNRYFSEDNEFVVYNSIKECIEKIEYYLMNEKEREEISDRGYKRYLVDHTIEVRMQKVLKVISEK